MTLTINLILFVLVVAAVAATRRLLVYELSALSLLILHRRRPGLALYGLITFPGTVVHELSHWLMAELLQVPTGRFRLLVIPQEQGQEASLGSVMTAKVDPFRGFLIGLSPFLTGLAIMIVLNRLLLDYWGHAAWWQIGLVLYGQIVTANSLALSPSDRRYWPLLAILSVIILVIVINSGLTLSAPATNWLSTHLTSLNLVLATALAINLVLPSLLFGVRYLVQKTTGRIVVEKRS